MTFREVVLLLPCHSLEDFPTFHTGPEASGLLAAWTVAWHPRLIAMTERLPLWHRADDPPDRPRRAGARGQAARRSHDEPGHTWRPFNDAQWFDLLRLRPAEDEYSIRDRLDAVRDAGRRGHPVGGGGMRPARHRDAEHGDCLR